MTGDVNRRMDGRVRTRWLGAGVALVASLCAVGVYFIIAPGVTAQTGNPPGGSGGGGGSPGSVPTALAVAAALDRSGVSPESLAVAGAGTDVPSPVITAARTWLADQAQTLSAADAAVAAARGDVERLESTIRAGAAGGASVVTSLSAARASLQSASDDLAAALRALRDASVSAAGLTDAQAALLLRHSINRATELPNQFQTVERTDADWTGLRDALANERIALALGRTPATAPQALLAQVRATPAVSAASANLTARLSGLRSAWAQALAGLQ